jgi:hypothetical protein
MNKLNIKYTSEEKLRLSLRLYYSAKELKAAAIKTFNPELSNKEVEEKLRKLFLYGKY